MTTMWNPYTLHTSTNIPCISTSQVRHTRQEVKDRPYFNTLLHSVLTTFNHLWTDFIKKSTSRFTHSLVHVYLRFLGLYSHFPPYDHPRRPKHVVNNKVLNCPTQRVAVRNVITKAQVRSYMWRCVFMSCRLQYYHITWHILHSRLFVRRAVRLPHTGI